MGVLCRYTSVLGDCGVASLRNCLEIPWLIYRRWGRVSCSCLHSLCSLQQPLKEGIKSPSLKVPAERLWGLAATPTTLVGDRLASTGVLHVGITGGVLTEGSNPGFLFIWRACEVRRPSFRTGEPYRPDRAIRHKTNTLAEFPIERPLVLAESTSLDDSGQDSLQRPQARSGHTCEDVERAALLRGLPTCLCVFVVVGTKNARL